MSNRSVFALILVLAGCLAGAAGAAAETAPWTPQAPAALVCPVPTAAEGALPHDPAADRVFLVQGPCTVYRDCFRPNTCPSYACPDVTIQCSSGPNGYCSSGPGGSCGGWVECDGDRDYCLPEACPPGGCGGAPSCNKHSDCTAYCSPDPPFCSASHCCICI